MNASTNRTEIVSDPTVPLVRITREFNAPPQMVFRAHVDAELFTQWNGPDGSDMNIDHHDCRTGGSYRYSISRDGFEAGFYGSFHAIELRR